MSADARIGELYRQKVKETAALKRYRLELERLGENFVSIGNRIKRNARHSAGSPDGSERRAFSFPSDCEINHRIRAIESTESAIREIESELETLTG